MTVALDWSTLGDVEWDDELHVSRLDLGPYTCTLLHWRGLDKWSWQVIFDNNGALETIDAEDRSDWLEDTRGQAKEMVRAIVESHAGLRVPLPWEVVTSRYCSAIADGFELLIDSPGNSPGVCWWVFGVDSNKNFAEGTSPTRLRAQIAAENAWAFVLSGRDFYAEYYPESR